MSECMTNLGRQFNNFITIMHILTALHASSYWNQSNQLFDAIFCIQSIPLMHAIKKKNCPHTRSTNNGHVDVKCMHCH